MYRCLLCGRRTLSQESDQSIHLQTRELASENDHHLPVDCVARAARGLGICVLYVDFSYGEVYTDVSTRSRDPVGGERLECICATTDRPGMRHKCRPATVTGCESGVLLSYRGLVLSDS